MSSPRKAVTAKILSFLIAFCMRRCMCFPAFLDAWLRARLQALSTRPDLLPGDYLDELEQLQVSENAANSYMRRFFMRNFAAALLILM